jgi:hypothetical protein
MHRKNESKQGIFYLFHVGRCVVLQVGKVLGVGVMVEVGLHGLKNFCCWKVMVGSSGEGSGV